MSDNQDTKDGRVGPGRPPVHSRFKPGRSGNPRGRPKGSKNGRVLLTDELNEAVPYVENGKRAKTSKLGLIIKQAVNKAVKGELKPLLELLKHFGPDVAGSKEEELSDALDSPDDLETRASLFRRIRAQS